MFRASRDAMMIGLCTAFVGLTVSKATPAAARDAAPPAVSITQPANGVWTGPPPSGQELSIAWDHPADGASMCTAGLATGWVVIGGSGARTGSLTIDGKHILDHHAGPGPDKKEGRYFWNTEAYASGPHTLTVTIQDQAGDVASSSIVVNLQNPVPAVTSPVNGATAKVRCRWP